MSLGFSCFPEKWKMLNKWRCWWPNINGLQWTGNWMEPPEIPEKCDFSSQRSRERGNWFHNI